MIDTIEMFERLGVSKEVYNFGVKIEEKLVFNQNLMKNDSLPLNRKKELDAENVKLNNILNILK